jgi:hypothetical protein
MKNNRKIIYLIFALLVAIPLLFFNKKNSNGKMAPEIYNKLKVIGQKHIYFGHKSVGENIVSGLNIIISENGKNALKINELNDNFQFGGNYFIHSNIGQNGDPIGKCREFSSIINNLSNKNLDMAMMKLCFVDINKNSNIYEVFKYYNATIDSIQKKYHDLTVIHFTVPLKSKPSWINKIKDMIKGRKNYDTHDNLARNKYNELLFSKYSKKDIFDLAAAESTYPDGNRESIVFEGKRCYFLISDYTDDGGHLNDKGKQVIAEKLINQLYNKINLN